MIKTEELQGKLERVSVSKTFAADGLYLPKAEHLLEPDKNGVRPDLREGMLEDTRSYLHNKPPINKNFTYYQLQDMCRIHKIEEQYGRYCGLPANRVLNIAALFEGLVFGFRACELNRQIYTEQFNILQQFIRRHKIHPEYIKTYPSDIFEYLRGLKPISQNRISVFDFDFNGHLTKHVDEIIKSVERHGTDKCVVAVWSSIGHTGMSEDADYLPLIERLYNGWTTYEVIDFRRFAYQDSAIPMRVELLVLSRNHKKGAKNGK